MLRRILFAVIAVIVVCGAAWAFWPRPVVVETATIATRALDVTVEDEGVSRIKDVYTISAPISGKLLRLRLQPGDSVRVGTSLATIEPMPPGLLDARARAVARANVAAAQSAVEQATAQQQQAQAQLDFAQDQLARAQTLRKSGIITDQALQKADLDASTALTAVNAAKANLTVRQEELGSARAALIEISPSGCAPTTAGPNEACADVQAPISGRVLSVSTTSEQVVAAGAPLLTMGDPQKVEIAVNLLSRDSVAVVPGDAASLEGWGGAPLRAVVVRVDPAAVTKVSALGIEEQRVPVVLQLVDAAAVPDRLGHQFRVVVRITVWHGNDLVAVPMGALFRAGNDWAVFVVAAGKATVRRLQLGQQNADYAEVKSGLAAGDAVILHPGDRIVEGLSVTTAASSAS